jgi:hypothetical protein
MRTSPKLCFTTFFCTDHTVRYHLINLTGIFWYIKDCIFPDPAFQAKVPLMSAGIAWVATLGPYMVPAYRLATR